MKLIVNGREVYEAEFVAALEKSGATKFNAVLKIPKSAWTLQLELNIPDR